MELPEFAPGTVARVELTVTDADTAQSVGSGDVPVLATPRVLALAEAATVAATARQLPAGVTTVHVSATGAAGSITVLAASERGGSNGAEASHARPVRATMRRTSENPLEWTPDDGRPKTRSPGFNPGRGNSVPRSAAPTAKPAMSKSPEA